ncbi:MAG: peptidoglycan-binding protein [Nitrospinae bacterium]|nr:peptidoglycan-binding protein [Nitrospinota bacterium]
MKSSGLWNRFFSRGTLVAAGAAALLLGGCATEPTMGGSKGNTVTGGAGGATSQGANSQLEHCDETLGTVAVYENTTQSWWYELQSHKLGSTIPVLRVMIQQSNCFVIVERGKAMKNVMQEREMEKSGEMRGGSNFGKGQMVSADYTMEPEITFSAKGTQGGGAALGGLIGGRTGALIGGGFRANEASTTLLLVDNRSSVQVSASTGSAKNFDFAGFGGLFTAGLGAVGGGYSNTPEGKVIVSAFADSYNQMIKALRSYKAQQVKGGLGTGGRLGVSGGSTPASKELEEPAPAPTKEKKAKAAKPKPKKPAAEEEE